MRVAPVLRIDRSMADRNPPEDDLSDLRRRVAKAQGSNSTSPPPDSAASLALRFGGEFGAAVIVGALLGYGIGYLLHAESAGLLIGIGLGFATGLVNVVRVARAYNNANPPDPNAPKIPDDDDD
jgi:F0F1-type ATP synthase assembly protein I